MKEEKSFTLVELLVVIGIIILISGISFTNIRLGGEELALERSAFKLAKDLRKAEEESISAKEFSCPGGEILKGYGLKFQKDNQFYSSFARCKKEPPFNDIVIDSEIPFEKDIKIKDLRRDGLSIFSLEVFFYPPDPKVDFGGEEGEIIISPKINSKIRTIKVNKIGLIEILK